MRRSRHSHWVVVVMAETLGFNEDGTRKGQSTVYIPGNAIAYYEDGKITRLVFQPHAGDAGYFGPSAMLFEGDETLDLEDTDAPFWKGVQQRLQDEHAIEWVE